MGIIAVLVLLLVAVVVCRAAFKAGKREGSRKGYGVGFARGRRARSSSGCLLVIIGTGWVLIAAAAALACW